MSKFLFSASLETHMNKYMADVKLNEINEQYQLMQMKIVREGEQMQLTQAEIMNRLDQLKDELKQKISESTKVIPLSMTQALETSPTIPETYNPLTSSEYENISNRKSIIQPRKDVINELKEKIQSRKHYKMLTEMTSVVNKKEINKLLDSLLSDLIQKGLTKQEVIKNTEKVLNELKQKASTQQSTKINPSLISQKTQQPLTQLEEKPTVNELKQSLAAKRIQALAKGRAVRKASLKEKKQDISSIKLSHKITNPELFGTERTKPELKENILGPSSIGPSKILLSEAGTSPGYPETFYTGNKLNYSAVKSGTQKLLKHLQNQKDLNYQDQNLLSQWQTKINELNNKTSTSARSYKTLYDDIQSKMIYGTGLKRNQKKKCK